jgi:Lantibiotic biosynthesis dehydratase C-term
MRNDTWLSVHLYYNEPWEVFLTKSVHPFVETLLQTGIIQQYFYIRYWERGPHIRLRLYGEQATLEKVLKPSLLEHFNNYFEWHPSQRVEPKLPTNTKESYRWLPNNSVQWIDYTPELLRYCGKLGLEVSEQQFFTSSQVALSSIKRVGANDWDKNSAMGVAIKLHLSLAHIVGMNLEQAALFFKQVFHHWLPEAFRYHRNRLTTQQFEAQSESMLQTFEQSFQAQRETLVSYHAALWEALENDADFEENELHEWLAANRIMHEKLDDYFDSGKLTPRPSELLLRTAMELDPKTHLFWTLYSDYIHLTNNRLGILNNEEGFLAYLSMRSLETMQ